MNQLIRYVLLAVMTVLNMAWAGFEPYDYLPIPARTHKPIKEPLFECKVCRKTGWVMAEKSGIGFNEGVPFNYHEAQEHAKAPRYHNKKIFLVASKDSWWIFWWCYECKGFGYTASVPLEQIGEGKAKRKLNMDKLDKDWKEFLRCSRCEKCQDYGCFKHNFRRRWKQFLKKEKIQDSY